MSYTKFQKSSERNTPTFDALGELVSVENVVRGAWIFHISHYLIFFHIHLNCLILEVGQYNSTRSSFNFLSTPRKGVSDTRNIQHHMYCVLKLDYGSYPIKVAFLHKENEVDGLVVSQIAGKIDTIDLIY